MIKMRYFSKEEFDLEMKKIQLKNERIKLKNELKAEKNKYRKPMNTSNKILVSAIIAIILFTIACLYVQYHTGVEVSSTLITLWFSFWTVEIVVLAGIKVSKVLKNTSTLDNNVDIEDIKG